MNKAFTPTDVFTATNSKVTGVSIDFRGNLREVRVAVKFKPQDNFPILTDKTAINPIEAAWERIPATR